MEYILISPLKDEALFIEETLRSVINQTVLPICWVIVDDGSADNSCDIVNGYIAKYPFIHLLHTKNIGRRAPGIGVIRAFNTGYESVKAMPFDLLVKLDCDLRLPEDYFEQLLGRFSNDNRLGIASGVYLEKSGQEWIEVTMPSYHAAGAAKMIRRECFEEIGGFIPSRGWDTVDEIKAITRRWKTKHFRDLRMFHLKAEGSGVGSVRTNMMHGEIYYATGGSPFFFLLKFLHRLRCRPFVVGAAALLWGYIWAMYSSTQILVNEEEARKYRGLLNTRVTDWLQGCVSINRSRVSKVR